MQLTKKHYIWGGVIVLIVAGGVLVAGNKKTAPLLGTTTVKRGDIIQEVSVTGRVKPTSAVDLGFEKSGRVSRVYVSVGQHVKAGDILAEIDSSSAQGNLQQAEARLAELKRGSRPEEINVKKAELAKDTQDLNNAYDGITDIRNDAYAKADDALHSKITGIFSGYQPSSYKYTYSICDSQLTINGEWLRYTSENDFSTWRTENATFPANPTNAELVASLTSAGNHLNKIAGLFDSISQSLSLDCTIANSALDTYRTNVGTARTNINAALAAINAKEQEISTLTLTVAKIKDELALLEAGTAAEVISAQGGLVLAAQGELAKYRILAPIGGVITKADIKSGEDSTVGAPVFSIISDTSFKIEAPVPEADIAKIKIGDGAKITLDAYGSDTIFDAKVAEIDPAETIIDNVPTYKTTFYFTKNDTRIKSGMTANIDVQTATRKDVLFVPERSIIARDGQKYIRVVGANNSTTDTTVTTGLKGSDGTTEILTGVSEGDTIIMSPTD